MNNLHAAFTTEHQARGPAVAVNPTTSLQAQLLAALGGQAAPPAPVAATAAAPNGAMLLQLLAALGSAGVTPQRNQAVPAMSTPQAPRQAQCVTLNASSLQASLTASVSTPASNVLAYPSLASACLKVQDDASSSMPSPPPVVSSSSQKFLERPVQSAAEVAQAASLVGLLQLLQGNHGR